MKEKYKIWRYRVVFSGLCLKIKFDNKQKSQPKTNDCHEIFTRANLILCEIYLKISGINKMEEDEEEKKEIITSGAGSMGGTSTSTGGTGGLTTCEPPAGIMFSHILPQQLVVSKNQAGYEILQAQVRVIFVGSYFVTPIALFFFQLMKALLLENLSLQDDSRVEGLNPCSGQHDVSHCFPHPVLLQVLSSTGITLCILS